MMAAALLLAMAAFAEQSKSIEKPAQEAAETAQVKLPAERVYFYWMSYKDADGNPQQSAPGRIEGTTDEIDYSILGFRPQDVILKVLDPKSGNMAVKPLKPTDGALPAFIKLKSDDFDHVRSVRIRVTAKGGRPVESGLISLTDAANKKSTQVIDPTSRGIAAFQDIAAGVVTVRVNCAGRKSVNDLDIPLKRESAAFEADISIPGDVPTLKPTASSEGREAARPASRPQPRGITATTLIQTIVGLVFLILVGYVILIVLKSRKLTIAEALKKVGVTLPGEAGTPEAQPTLQPQTDPSICQFCGQKKDPITGACACTVSTAPAAAPAAAGPRLIGIAGPYMGQIFQLAGEVSTIGREAANTVALTQDATTSRRHARIARQNGRFLIYDEGSANGTMVNGRRIAEPTQLSSGDEIQIGSTRFRFEVS